jgi:hypothetical protein
MARSPFSFLTEVVTRRKSSPWATNTVALAPGKSRAKASTSVVALPSIGVP